MFHDSGFYLHATLHVKNRSHQSIVQHVEWGNEYKWRLKKNRWEIQKKREKEKKSGIYIYIYIDIWYIWFVNTSKQS